MGSGRLSGWITRSWSDYVSRERQPGDCISRVTQIRLTSPESSKPDNLFKNKITQPLTSPEFPESDHVPPELPKPDHLNIPRVNITRPSQHPPSKHNQTFSCTCTCTRQFHFLICLQLCSHWSRSFAASLLLVERQEQEMTVQEMDFMHTAVSLSKGCKEIEKFNKIVACQFPLASQSINCLPPHCSLLKLHSSLAVSSSSSFISQQFLSTVVSDSQGCGETFLASHLPQLRSFSFLDMYC